MMIHANEQEERPSIELTPIVDMVFLLLIFFLVATTFHQTEREMQIALPAAASGGPISTALREIVVNVNANGGIVVGGRPMEAGALAVLVREAVAANPDQKVTVRGDRACSYDGIARVLDVCKTSGVQEPYLDTVPLGGP